MCADSSPATNHLSDQDQTLETLLRVNQFIASVRDLHELLFKIMEESEHLLEAEASAVMLYDEVTDELYFEVVRGEAADEVRNIRLKVSDGQGIGGKCALTRKPIIVGDAQRDERHDKTADQQSSFTTTSLLAVPLVHKGNLIGVLEVLNKRGGGVFNDADIRVMEIIANQAAITIENARLIEKNIHNERLAAMGTAMAGISHGIKNILAGVRGSASLIEHALGLDPVNMEMVQEAWPILMRNEQRISDLMQDMLMYSKRREPELSNVSITLLCKEICETCLEQANLCGVALETRLPEDLLNTAVDVKAMHDCVLNLVTNAIDATPSGDDALVYLEAEAGEDENSIIIRVCDNGTGIPDQILQKIWEPFFSTKGKKGTGLGLAMTRKTIEEHGGQINVVSVQDEGTTFTIRLPLKSVKEDAQG